LGVSSQTGGRGPRSMRSRPARRCYPLLVHAPRCQCGTRVDSVYGACLAGYFDTERYRIRSTEKALRAIETGIGVASHVQSPEQVGSAHLVRQAILIQKLVRLNLAFDYDDPARGPLCGSDRERRPIPLNAWRVRRLSTPTIL